MYTYCVYFANIRGKSASVKDTPFRVWYSKLVELKSLLPKTRYAIFTATATKATKQAIFDMLVLTHHDTFCVEKEPTRSNTSYYFVYLEKSLLLEIIFEKIINELKEEKQQAERTIVFCQTRKQCSLMYRMFVVALGNMLYNSDEHKPNTRRVEMYHAGTPESVKTHIINEMGRFGSHLRLIICTVAFGMGINCKDVYRSIHFGPPKTVEQLVQECGRIGRDGMQCTCYILYNGLLTSHCDEQMKELIKSKSCRRQCIVNLFSASNPELSTCGESCRCCDNCSHICNCSNPIELVQFGKDEKLVSLVKGKKREVTDAQRHVLLEKIANYRKSLLPKNVTEFMPVTPNILFEFSLYQIEQVMKNCHELFTMEDILSRIELWRHVHANNIYAILSETFHDMNELSVSTQMSEDEFMEMEIVTEDWEEIRDDSSLCNSTLDISTESFVETSFENSLVDDCATGENNISGIFQSMVHTIDMDISNA